MTLARALPLAMLMAFTLSGCTEIMLGSHIWKKGQGTPARCTAEGMNKVGNPYLVDGVRYTPIPSSWGYKEQGIASWYGDDFHGKSTANGECYNMYAFTAAHKTLPLPTIARVTNLENNRSIIVKINDRGPYARGRILDLSYAAAQSLGVVGHGTAPVQVEAIGGPFYSPSGLAGTASQRQRVVMAPHDQVAETLPTVVPQTLAEEELTPSFTKRIAEENAATLPPPPPPEKRPYTSTAPLEHSRAYVQIGAFSEEPRAQNAKRELKAQAGSAEIAPLTLASGTRLFRVRTGPFNTLEQAEEMLQKVAQNGFAAAQIKIEKEND